MQIELDYGTSTLQADSYWGLKKLDDRSRRAEPVHIVALN
jgi:hypothetical protein